MRGHPFKKGHIPHNKSVWVDKKCLLCGTDYSVPPYRKESKTCSRNCHNTRISREWDHSGDKNPMWAGGIQTYRQYKKDGCEICFTKEKLIVHHMDENRYNNELQNLQTLCRKCHQTIHGILSRRDKFGKFVGAEHAK